MMIRTCFGHVLVRFWRCFGHVLGKFWLCFKHALGMFRPYFWHVLGMFGGCFEDAWAHVGDVLGDTLRVVVYDGVSYSCY